MNTYRKLIDVELNGEYINQAGKNGRSPYLFLVPLLLVSTASCLQAVDLFIEVQNLQGKETSTTYIVIVWLHLAKRIHKLKVTTPERYMTNGMSWNTVLLNLARLFSIALGMGNIRKLSSVKAKTLFQRKLKSTAIIYTYQKIQNLRIIKLIMLEALWVKHRIN